MDISFTIDYHTNWGESIYIVGSIPALGDNDESKAIEMVANGEHTWHLCINTAIKFGTFSYRYFVRSNDCIIRREYGKPHTVRICRGVTAYEILDNWQEQQLYKPLSSSVFTDCIYRRTTSSEPQPLLNNTVTLQVCAPTVMPDQVLAISGSNVQTGNWNPDKAIIMNDADFPQWSININLKDITIPFQYKFIILDAKSYDIIEWEDGDNRTFDIHQIRHNTAIVINGLTYRSHKRMWRGAGVAIPVFSIRSNDDFGVGDFIDLKLMVDWAVATGQKILQILPINDTTMTGTWTDSYPYNANSTFALHPMYLRLQAMGTLHDQEKEEQYMRLRKELNKLSHIDYERVNNAKNAYTRELFNQDWADTMATSSFKCFMEHNSEWLKPYAAFCVLRNHYGTADYNQWGQYAKYSPSKIKHFITIHHDDVNYIYYIQYHLDKQLREIREYAHTKGVAIKGDIPIGISRTSVDAWMYPNLFNIDSQAGAPPDDFSVLGQNWGFPTYNWEEMSHDGYAWWKARMCKMSEYFDAFRIDHILGFFRIWQIPINAIHGLLGIFHPAIPFSTDELQHKYGFILDVSLHTSPYITDQVLNDLCPEVSSTIKQSFISRLSDGRYKLKAEYATQRQVTDYFNSIEQNASNTTIRNALLKLIDDVLFIEDPHDKSKYHPRISAQRTYSYNALSDYHKQCFDKLYNDFFYHRHNQFWQYQAMQKLPPLINATNMLVCAEDLGMIPACVPDVIRELEILSLEIQRMPKAIGVEFGDTMAYPYLSVCTTSTHDMSGIRQWWEEDQQKTQHFFNNILHESGEAPISAEPWICDKIVTQHLHAPSMLTILPIQDWLSLNGDIRYNNPAEEQINIPSNPHHYWRYRLHIPIEDLISNERFCSYLRNKITESGR